MDFKVLESATSRKYVPDDNGASAWFNVTLDVGEPLPCAMVSPLALSRKNAALSDKPDTVARTWVAAGTLKE